MNNHARLLSIGARNLKGCSFDLQLAPATFIVAPNFAGKTARTDAIRLLLLGYLPERGKLNSKTFELASGPQMEVFGVVVDALGVKHQMQRKWWLEGNSVKSSKDVPPFLESGEIIETMLSASAWFGLSEAERVAWVFRNAAVESEMSFKKLSSLLSPALAAEAFPEKEEARIAPEELDKFLAELQRLLSVAERDDGPFSGPEYVEAALAKAQEIEKNAKDYAKRMEGTLQGLASLRASDENPPDLDGLAEAVKRVQADLDALNADYAVEKKKLESALANNRRKTALASDLLHKDRLVANVETEKANLTRLAREKDDAEKELAALPSDEGSSLNDMKVEENSARDALAAYEADLRVVVVSISENESELAQLKHQTSCPYCKAEGVSWKDKKRSEIESALAGLRSKKETLEKHVGVLKDAVESLKNKTSGMIDRINDRIVFADKIRKKDAEIAAQMRRIADAEALVAELARKQGEHDAIEKIDFAETEAKVDGLATKIRLKQTEQREAAAAHAAGAGRKNDLQRLAQAEKQRDQAKNEQRLAKAAVTAIKEIKASVVAEAFAPILKVANSFAGNLLPEPLAYNAARAEIGAYKNGAWVGVGTFSGVEQLMAFAGIQAAFASRGVLRVMILDEMLRAQDTRSAPVFTRLIEACKRAVKNEIVDGFVGIIPGDPESYPFLVTTADKEACKVVTIG